MDVNLERRIRKHIHAQRHTFECQVPAGFAELGMRSGKHLLAEYESPDSENALRFSLRGSRVRIENLPFDAINQLLFNGLVFSDIRLRMLRARCTGEQKLRQLLAEFPWELWALLKDAAEWEIRVDSQASHLYHEGKIKQIVREEVQKLFAQKAAADTAGASSRVELDFILHREVLEIFISVSGRDFWKRGHKQTFEHAAPLREDIAACLVLRLSELSREKLKLHRPSHIFNPFCGTGTLMHEAALFLSGSAHLVSDNQHWAYPTLPFFKDKAFSHFRKKQIELRSKENGQLKLIHFLGEDLDPRLCEVSEKWFAQAGQHLHTLASANAVCRDSCQSTEAYPADSQPSSLWIFANPPYGLRLSNRAQGGTEQLYLKFFQRMANLSRNFAEKSLPLCGVVLCPSEETWRIGVREMKGSFTHCEHFTLGGLDVRAFYFLNNKKSG
jgi:23S rRNA G2445 N2-methylase RlmL